MRGPAFLLMAAVVVAGCATGPDLPDPSPLPALKARSIIGQTVWSTDTGDGAGSQVTGLQLALDGRQVYAGNPDGEVTALALASGETIWQVESGFDLIAGPAAANDMLYFGTRNGLVAALSAKDGSTLWTADLGSEVLAAPAAAQESVVVRTIDGRVVSLDMATGAHRWTVERQVPTLTLRGIAPPVIDAGVVYVGLDNGEVLALKLDTGELLWVQQVAVPTGRSELERIVDVDAGLLLAGDELYAVSVGKRLASISRADGQLRWSSEVASRTGMTFDTDQIFVTDMESRLLSFARDTGARQWSQEALIYRRLTQPVVYRGYLMVADYEGYLHWMIPEGGAPIGRYQAVDAAVRTAPLVVGDLILVLATDGTVSAVKGVFPEREPK